MFQFYYTHSISPIIFRNLERRFHSKKDEEDGLWCTWLRFMELVES